MTVTAVSPAVRFKIATEDWEFEQIHRLNYETFVEEIPQHAARPERLLVDRFHDQNTYFIALRGRILLGMLALRLQRPFSLDGKLPDLDSYLPPGRLICEVRLLATTKENRNGMVFRRLVDDLTRYALEQGFDTAVISATVRQLKLYKHMGFVPFGPVVGSGDALYQPMYLTLEAMRKKANAFPSTRTARRPRTLEPLNFLPGPVAVAAEITEAFQRAPVSHRSVAFVRDFQETRQRLCDLVHARNVQILMGSGTLANDVVAAQISTWRLPGLVLSNGAFGERIIDQAHRFGLRFETHEVPWGKPFERRVIETTLDLDPSLRWIWAVHGETSTGVLNDLGKLKDIAAARDVRLCIDAVSSLGSVPADLSGVALASGVSGKGFGAYSGLALVFHSLRPVVNAAIPRYLDLGFYTANEGMPFTLSSNLLYALKTALERFEGVAHYERLARTAEHLRAELREIGLGVAAEGSYFPAVVTIALPSHLNSLEVGQRLEDAGFLLNYRSSHLPSRNWIQACLMGDIVPEAVDELLGALSEHTQDMRT